MQIKVFDQIEPKSLERRMWQLWVLALTTILVLATGLAMMMYSTVFSKPVGVSGHTFTTLFAGYCVLMPLVIGYLFDRQLVIRQLRRKITEEEKQIMNLQHEVRANFLETLPGLAHFQDRLTMEFRRAATAEQPVSLVIAGVKPARGLSSPADITSVYGDAAKGLTRKLRGEDSIYHFDPGVFGILLPRVPTDIAKRVCDRLEEGLIEAAGPEARFAFELHLANYPDQAASARELENVVRDFLSVRRKKPLAAVLTESPAVAA